MSRHGNWPTWAGEGGHCRRSIKIEQVSRKSSETELAARKSSIKAAKMTNPLALLSSVISGPDTMTGVFGTAEI